MYERAIFRLVRSQ